MAANAGYYVVGARELRAALARAELDVEDLKSANQRVSDFVAGVARFMAPVGETGNLQLSIRGTRQVGRAVVRAGNARVPYAGNRHWGWPTRPNPRKGWRGGPIKADYFIVDAARQSEDQWLPIYIADINAIIDKIAGATA